MAIINPWDKKTGTYKSSGGGVKDPKHDPFKGLINPYKKAATAAPKPTVIGEFKKGLARGVPQLKESWAGLGAIGGKVMEDIGIPGGTALKEYALEKAEKYQEEAIAVAPPAEVPRLTDIEGTKDALMYASKIFGQQIPILGETIATALAGGMIGSAATPVGTIGGAALGVIGKSTVKGLIRKQTKHLLGEFAKKKFKKEVTGELSKSVAKRMATRNVLKMKRSKIGQIWGARVGMAAGIMPLESGSNYLEGLHRGIDNPYTALGTGAVATAIEFLGGGSRFIDMILNPAKASKSFMRNLARSTGKQIYEEGLQEGLQEVMSMVNLRLNDPKVSLTDKEALLRYLESVAAGGIMGGAFGVGQTVYTAASPSQWKKKFSKAPGRAPQNLTEPPPKKREEGEIPDVRPVKQDASQPVNILEPGAPILGEIKPVTEVDIPQEERITGEQAFAMPLTDIGGFLERYGIAGEEYLMPEIQEYARIKATEEGLVPEDLDEFVNDLTNRVKSIDYTLPEVKQDTISVIFADLIEEYGAGEELFQVEPEKPAQIKEPKKIVKAVVSHEEYKPDQLAWMREMVDIGAPGTRGQDIDPVTKEYVGPWKGKPSTYPIWMQHKKLTKKKVLNILDKAIKGEELQESQIEVLKELYGTSQGSWEKYSVGEFEAQDIGEFIKDVDLSQGDTITIELEGKTHDLEITNIDKDGIYTLANGVTLKVDPSGFLTEPVQGKILEVKKGEGKELTPKPKADILKKALDDYEETLDIEELTGVLEDHPDEDISQAVEEYNQALIEDREEYGMRSGLPEDAADKLVALLKEKTKPFLTAPKEKIEKKKKPTQPDMLGPGDVPLEKIPAEQAPETPLESAQRKSKERKEEKEFEEKQEKLPEYTDAETKRLMAIGEGLMKGEKGAVIKLRQAVKDIGVGKVKHFIGNKFPAITPEYKTIQAEVDAIYKEGGFKAGEVFKEEVEKKEPWTKEKVKKAWLAGEELPDHVREQWGIPSEAQIEAGNYKKKHITIAGLEISIETQKGQLRVSKAKAKERWISEMKSDYGHILGTKGKDGDPLDVFLGPATPEKIFVINQANTETGKFDEHKVMLGFKNEVQARARYLENYDKDIRGKLIMSVETLSMDEFLSWIKGDTTKEFKAEKEQPIEPISQPSDVYITADTNLDSIMKQYPYAIVAVKDVNGFRARIKIDNFIKLSKEKGFTDRIRQVLLLSKGGPETINEGFMRGTFEQLKRKAIESKVERAEEPQEVISPIEGIKFINNSTVMKSQIPLFQNAIKNTAVRNLLISSGIKEVSIEPPYKFSLSEQANISIKKGRLQINADATDPTNSILHELGHVEYDKMTVKQKEAFKNEILTTKEKYRKESLAGYISNDRWEEVFSDDFALSHSDTPEINRLKQAIDIVRFGPGSFNIVGGKAVPKESVTLKVAEMQKELKLLEAPKPTEVKAFTEGARVKLPHSPQDYTIIKVIKSTPEEVELGEQYFEIKNNKTGETDTIEKSDINIIKKQQVDKVSEGGIIKKDELSKVTGKIDTGLAKIQEAKVSELSPTDRANLFGKDITPEKVKKTLTTNYLKDLNRLVLAHWKDVQGNTGREQATFNYLPEYINNLSEKGLEFTGYEEMPIGGVKDFTLSFMGTGEIENIFRSLSVEAKRVIKDLKRNYTKITTGAKINEKQYQEWAEGKRQSIEIISESVFEKYTPTFRQWGQTMKNIIGDAWKYFKNMAFDVYRRTKARLMKVRAFNEKLGEGGFIDLTKKEKAKVPPFREYTPKQKEAKSKIAPQIPGRTIKEKLVNVTTNLGLKLRQGIIDQYASIRKYTEKGWKLARLSHSGTGAMEGLFIHGLLRIDNEGAITVDTNSEGLASILRPLGEEMDDWLAWIAGNRAEKLKKEGREKLFSDEDIVALKSLATGTMENGLSRKMVYMKVFKEFQKFQNSVLDISTQTGLVSTEERAIWENDFYVPFYRFLEETEEVKGPKALEGLTNQTAFKRLTGAPVPLNDLLSNVLMNWNHLLSASLKNQAATVTLEAVAKEGAAKRVSSKYKSKDAIFIRKNGKRVWYEISDPLILEAVTALGWEGFNNRAMKAIRGFKRVFTMGVTASPEFRIANLLRDTVHSVAVGKMSYNLIGNVLEGVKGTRRDSINKARMLAGGAEMHFGHTYAADPEAAKLRITKGLKEDTIVTTEKGMKRFTEIAKGVWEHWQEFGSRIENINRAALYERAIAKRETHFEASFQARDLMDFSQHGAWPAIRFLVQAIPFLNARIQGLDKMGRAIADPEQRKQFTVMTGAVAMASMMLYLAYKDDDDFKEREDWDRDTYWWFKIPGDDTAFRIPKPFEVGAIGTMSERLLEQIVDDKAHGELFAERLWHMLSETFNINVIPQMIQPALNVYANKDPFTKRPIHSTGMERLSPTERKKVWTSETAVLLSKGMDKISWGEVVLSPVQIEYLVRGYLGWVGSISIGTIDQVFTQPLSDLAVEPTRRIIDYPAVGRFVRTSPSRNTRYTTVFYENLKKTNQVYADIRNYRKFGEIEKAMELHEKNKQVLRLRKMYNKIQRSISNINYRMKLIHKNRAMSAQEKRREIDRLTLMKNKLTEMAEERRRKFIEKP